jgi:large subunit ribosomal protein L17
VRVRGCRAKAVRPVVERLITKAKKGDIASRRLVLRVVPDRDVVHKLFSEVAPQYAERNGGYTRIVKLGPRKGDAAPMALIELIAGEGDEE